MNSSCETILTLSIGGFPPLSSRGCTQELTTVIQDEFVRTLSGKLVSLGLFSGSLSKKYKTTITCQDITVVATGGLVPGMIIEVGCIQRLWQHSFDHEIVLDKKPVEGSVVAHDEEGRPVEFCLTGERCLVLNQVNKVATFVSYRPLLVMRLISYALETKEWEMKSRWRLELEEI